MSLLDLRLTQDTFCQFLRENEEDPFKETEKIKVVSTCQNMLSSTIVTFVSIYALESVFIIIGNSFAMFVFCTQRLYQKRTCFLLINLAVADLQLLVGLTEPIFLSTEKIRKMTGLREKKSPGNPSSAIQLLGSTTSVFFLALISLERVYAVLWPLRHRATSTRVYIYASLLYGWLACAWLD